MSISCKSYSHTREFKKLFYENYIIYINIELVRQVFSENLRKNIKTWRQAADCSSNLQIFCNYKQRICNYYNTLAIDLYENFKKH